MGNEDSRRDAPVGRLARVWSAIAIASVLAGLVLTFDPDFASAASTVVTLIPFLLLSIIGVAAVSLPERGPSSTLTVTTIVATAGWAVLIIDDDRWSILTFALLGLCFSVERGFGVVLALAVSTIWTAAWIDDGVEGWQLLIPLAGFGAGVVLWSTLRRAEIESATLADVVERLETAQADLAAAEHERGVLAERARFAGEIHDTLAQGFTSIVVLSRAAQRTGDLADAVSEIESVAQDHLVAARRLVAAIGPADLESLSLADAMRRQLGQTIDPTSTTAHFEVSGDTARLPAEVEVTLFRGLQETLLNVRKHAEATQVHVTLSYLGDVVALDVRDDGRGFTDGIVADHGDLTGGQGLRALRHRIEALGGELTIETTSTGGSAVSLQLPAVTS